jgi:hypothetical protein
LQIEECHVVSAADPPWSLISVFLTGVTTFFSSSSSFILTRAKWTPFQTHCYSENLAVPGIEPGTSGSAARKSDEQTTEAVCLFTQLHTTAGVSVMLIVLYFINE